MALYSPEGNLSELISGIPPETLASFGGLITILKAVGIAFIVYVIYVVLMAIVNIRRMKILERIEKKMDGLEKKINKLNWQIKNKKKFILKGKG